MNTTEAIFPLLQMMLLLGALAVALWLLLRWLKEKRLGPHFSSAVKIIQVLAVGTRERIVLIEADGQRFLIGVTPSAITPLWTLQRSSASFADLVEARHKACQSEKEACDA